MEDGRSTHALRGAVGMQSRCSAFSRSLLLLAEMTKAGTDWLGCAVLALMEVGQKTSSSLFLVQSCARSKSAMEGVWRTWRCPQPFLVMQDCSAPLGATIMPGMWSQGGVDTLSGNHGAHWPQKRRTNMCVSLQEHCSEAEDWIGHPRNRIRLFRSTIGESSSPRC